MWHINKQRILPVDMAVSLWLLVYSQNEPPLLKKWLHFLEKHPQVRGIPSDTWNMLINFTNTVGSDLTQYDDTEAWPSLFDDFVEFENDQLNQTRAPCRTSTGSPATVLPESCTVIYSLYWGMPYCLSCLVIDRFCQVKIRSIL